MSTYPGKVELKKEIRNNISSFLDIAGSRQKSVTINRFSEWCSWFLKQLFRLKVFYKSVKPRTLIKNRLWRRCFPLNFV